MKALRTKVILSGIVLVFAFIATIGTTFAWFTVSQTATVETMQLNVTTADSLNIMPYVDGYGYTNDVQETSGVLLASNYDTSISVAELNTAGYDVENYLLQPATVIDPGYTAFSGASGRTLSIIDLADRDLTLTTDKNATDGVYIELKFWLFYQGENAETVELNTLDITPSAGNNAAQDDVVNAIRLSIWEGEAGAVSGPQTPSDAVIFGLDNDYGYNFSGTANEDAVVGNELQPTATIQGGDANLAADASAATNTALTTDIFEIDPGVATLVTVLIYLEGWDAETTNDISLADFTIEFGFKLGTSGDSN
jgi:hypothetical protein